jgi:superfamily II DNA or RNA helicase
MKKLRRRFSSKERSTLFMFAEGKCARCGDPLQRGWHADHIEPWSQNGMTDVVNGQALCPRCNAKKGAGGGPMRDLYLWQKNALDSYLQSLEFENTLNFLVEATPGAGKTKFAAVVSKELLDRRLADRIVYVVPTVALRQQTARAVLNQTGIHLDYKWDGVPPFPGGEFSGVVVTYAGVCGPAELSFRKACAEVRTLAIFDEIHHASDEKSWGRKLRTAFERCVRRLLLSGTPFRTDNDAIPFVTYSEPDHLGKCKGEPDFSYGYAQALIDKVVRPAFFPATDGEMEWQDGDEIKQAKFSDPVNERDESSRFLTALRVMDLDSYIASIVRKAHAELTERRLKDPDAAGLVICMDQQHARDMANLLERLTGTYPRIAVSDDAGAHETISNFARGCEEWIVAVKMISEGVDIPRAQRVGLRHERYHRHEFPAGCRPRHPGRERRRRTDRHGLYSRPQAIDRTRPYH